MTQKEYARRRGITPQYVNKLVREKRILLRGGLVDPAQADAARTPSRAYTARPQQRRGDNSHGGGRPARQQELPPGAGEEAMPRSSATQSLTSARAAEAGFSARLKQLDFKERTGELLPAAEVLEAERRKNGNIRLRFRGLARVLAPLMARTAAAAECERLLLEEIDYQLAELARDPLAMAGPVAPAAAPPPESEPAMQPSAPPQQQGAA